MTEARLFVLAHHEARRRAMAAVADAPAGYVIRVEEPRRNLDQNALMWVLLDAFSRQLVWPVNGSMQRLTAEEWKDLLTAGFRQEQPRLAMGLRGGVVMMGLSTRKMGKREMADFITFIQSEAADRGVQFDEVEAA